MYQDESTWLDDLVDEALVVDVIRPLRGGKEAAVYLCEAHPATGVDRLVAKVYHDRRSRGFQNDAAYKHGRVIKDARVGRAMRTKTSFGRRADDGWWRTREFEVLTLLHGAGADVPRPVAQRGSATLLEFIGRDDEPAPQLRDLRPAREEVEVIFERLMDGVELFLSNNLVHADLSPYNVLMLDGRPVIIDFPQAVDARTNTNSQTLLARDVGNLCRWAARFGVDRPAERLVDDLWRRFLFAWL